MAKRLGRSDEESPHAKRRKLGMNEVNKNHVEEIKSPHALQRLLAFEQDEGSQVKQSMFLPLLLFRSFLTTTQGYKPSSRS